MLVEEVYKLIDAKRSSEFNRLPNPCQRTTVIHAIGKIIAGQRRQTAQTEIDDEVLMDRDEYGSCSHLYVMSQDVIF